jgi:hypothetical protein
MKEQGRFDTLFYIGFSSGLPQDQAVKDNAEVSAVMWSDPDQLLDQNRKEELWLAPPQVYELSRLKNFSKYDDLKKFSEVRSQRGLITWMPYIIPVADGAVSIYPQVKHDSSFYNFKRLFFQCFPKYLRNIFEHLRFAVDRIEPSLFFLKPAHGDFETGVF